MRSSKSRSRNKSSRNNRSPANNLNRVFDSSGPEGKVRGTPQQIIDKYSQLARDAWLGNDRVAAENFQQHAEHYTRMLAEAQRDADEKRAQADQQNRERQQQQQQQREAQQRREREQREANPAEALPTFVTQPGQPQSGDDHMEVIGEGEGNSAGGLVETPEAKPKKPRTRKPKAPKPAEEAPAGEGSDTNSDAAAE